MTVHPFPEPASVTDPVAEARAALGRANEVPAGDLSDAQLAEWVAEAARVEAAAAALRLRLSAEADERALAERESATGTDAWLARLTGDTREVANGGLWLARQLETKYAQTLAALAEGRINLKQVWVIVKAADEIPDWATPEQVAVAEDWLIQKASGAGNRTGRPMDPRRLRQAAHRMCAVVSPELAQAHSAAMLNRQRHHGEIETWMSLHDNGDGTWRGKFVLPELHAQILQRALEQLSTPRRWALDKTGQVVNDPTHQGFSWSEHYGLAFCELLEKLPPGPWGRNGINMIVTTTLDALRTGLGHGTLETGTAISPHDVRRLACEAGIIPAVLDGDSVPLDLGRLKRLHDDYQRRALALLYDSCAAAGCERPFAWCDIHHPKPWSQGGHTDLHNALPLCGFHHRRAHDARWELYQDDHREWRYRRAGPWDLAA